MKYRVVTLHRAEIDIRGIAAWIAKRSSAGAARWLEAYEAAVERLARHPESYALAEEDEVDPDHTLRQFFFKTRRGRTYRGIFVVEGDEVLVLRVRGPGQDLLTRDEFPL